MGLLALLFVGVPFISLSVILKLYYSSVNINEYLQKAAEIGHQMAERLQVNNVIDLFIQKLSKMLPVDYAYIFQAVGDSELHLVRQFVDGVVITESMPPISINEGISRLVWSKQKSLLFKTRNEWCYSTNRFLPIDAESILCVPIVRNKKNIGGLLLASKRKYSYEKSQLMIVDILCSYYAIAMENAKHYELTKMQIESCSLTKLYNYRYFESVLIEEFEKLQHFELHTLSLIILDIDHFKNLNDTYGHQGGNEILFELANRLSNLVGSRGTVAR